MRIVIRLIGTISWRKKDRYFEHSNSIKTHFLQFHTYEEEKILHLPRCISKFKPKVSKSPMPFIDSELTYEWAAIRAPSFQEYHIHMQTWLQVTLIIWNSCWNSKVIAKSHLTAFDSALQSISITRIYPDMLITTTLIPNEISYSQRRQNQTIQVC